MAATSGWGNSHWSKQISQWLDFHQSLKPEWRSKYLSYDTLLAYLEGIKTKQQEEAFLHAVGDELKQITKHYHSHLKFCQEKLDELCRSFHELRDIKPFSGLTRTTDDIRQEFIELYQEVEFLHSFLELNKHGINDILKGFREEIGGYEELSKILADEPWADMEDLHLLLHKIQNHFTNLFCPENPESAIFLLRSKETIHNQKDVFKAALYTGIALPLLLLILYIWFWLKPATAAIPHFWDVFPVFRCMLLFIIYIYLYGINTYFWKKSKINHVYLFNLNPKSHILNHVCAFKVASFLFCVWCACFFFYLGISKDTFSLFGLPSKWFPFFCCLVCITILFAPFHAFHITSRITLLHTILNLIITPFGYSRVREGFAADVFTSLVIPLQDLSYAFCYYFSNSWWSDHYGNSCHNLNKVFGQLISIIPYLWRFLQSSRHALKKGHKVQFINSGKYITAMMQVVLNAIHINLYEPGYWGWLKIAWIIMVVISSVYAFLWDTIMDWGMIQLSWKKWKKGRIFREDRKFKGWYYALSLLYNLVGRFFWSGTLGYAYIGSGKDFLKILFGCGELIRRANWSIIRLEWMQISNSMKFRKNKFVPALHD